MTLMIIFLMFIIESATEKLCALRTSIDVLEGEYFFLCYPKSMQEHFQEEAYKTNWYKENAGKQQLIKETHRIVPQMNFLEFWPAELGDSGNYSVTHRVHKGCVAADTEKCSPHFSSNNTYTNLIV